MITGPMTLFFLFILILGNGFLAMAEIALVSARKPLLQSRALDGRKGYQVALNLANSPGNFLSTVQIGITLAGILAGAMGEATIAEDLEIWLNSLGLEPVFSEAIGVGVVVILVSYVSLVFGELAPKKIGLIHAETISALVAPLIHFVSRITLPFVWLLNSSSALVLRILGVRASGEPTVTEDEVRILIDQGTKQGVFEPIEDAIVNQVFILGDMKAVSITHPRHEITWLDVNDAPEINHQKLLQNQHSRLPVVEDNLDNLLGYVRATDLLAQCLTQNTIDIHSAIRQPLFIPESLSVFTVLERFLQTGDEIAFTLDEYGGVLGIITPQDILEALIENLPGRANGEEPAVFQREDGSWLLDGTTSIIQVRDLFNLDELPGELEGHYHTLGGFLMAQFGHIPKSGEKIEYDDYRFEVMDMDGKRIDKVLVVRGAKSEKDAR